MIMKRGEQDEYHWRWHWGQASDRDAEKSKTRDGRGKDACALVRSKQIQGKICGRMAHGFAFSRVAAVVHLVDHCHRRLHLAKNCCGFPSPVRTG